MIFFVTLLVCAGMLFATAQRFENTCQPTEFQCRHTGRCISRDLVRNGNNNCGKNDASDEEEPLPKCHPQSEFRCRLNGQCVSREYINRPIYACFDKSDQGGITQFPCSRDNEVKCIENWCLSRMKVQHQINLCVPYGSHESRRKKLLECASDIHYTCSDGRCINRDRVADGIRHCKNGEDEEVLLPCTEEEYKCDDGRCILRFLVNDGIPNCSSDENNGTTIKCREDKEFTCHDRDTNNDPLIHCIPRDWVNDGIAHCKNGSDETVPFLKCNKDEWSCDKGKKCLSKSRLCDGIPDCMDCSDETDLTICSKEEASRFFICVNPIGLGEDLRSQMVLHSHCVIRSYFCDGITDCKDGSDDTNVGSGFKCRVTKLSQEGSESVTHTCILPHRMINDGISDCDDFSDELVTDNRPNLHFRCPSFNKDEEESMIKSSQVCDGIFDCPNLTDECLCNTELETSQRDINAVCSNVCYNLKVTANAKKIDENPLSDSCGICSHREVVCDAGSSLYSAKCIALLNICDGVVDCIDQMDEAFCSMDKSTESNANAKTRFNNTYICPLNDDLRYFIKTYPDIILRRAHRCDGVPECFGMADECDDVNDEEKLSVCKHIKSQPQFCQFFAGSNWQNFSTDTKLLKPSSVCDGVVDLEDSQDEMYCNDTRHSCKQLSLHEDKKIVNIDRKRVCDGHIDCEDESDELNCPEHFYCLNSSNPHFISRNKVLDGKSDCTDGSDECPMPDANGADPLSSRDEMMKYVFFRVWVWIISIIAVCGNLVVITTTIFRILAWQEVFPCQRFLKWIYENGYSQNRHASQLSKCNDILVANLAIADFLTGVYLLIIAVKSVSFSGLYCIHEMAWRSSSQCESLGIMVMTSIIASVGIMVALSSYRIFAVTKPWKVQHLKIPTSIAVVLVVWLAALLIGLLPTLVVLRDVFVTSVLVTADNGTKRSLYFSSKVVSKRALTSFLRKSCVLMTNDANNTSRVCNNVHSDYVPWVHVTEGLKEMFEELDVSGYFGYYSNHGVCLPSIYRSHHNDSDNLSQNTLFTTFLMVFIFFAFLFVALAYLMVCYRSVQSFQKIIKSKDSCHHPSSSQKRVSEMHKRIGRLVLTDLICWMPISVISFCGISGIHIQPWLYSFTVVILLPINSAVNPVIYSDVIAKLFKGFVKRIRINNRQLNSTSGTAHPNTETTAQYSAGSNRDRSLKAHRSESSPRKLSVVLNQDHHNHGSFLGGIRSFLSSTKTTKKTTRKSSQESLSLTVLPTANNATATANTLLKTTV